jgi:hypothetical protein
MPVRQPLSLPFVFRVSVAVLAMCSVGFGQINGLPELTVPTTKLPAGCELSLAPTAPLSGNRVRGGLWGGLQINRNPWSGVDRLMTATIRERIDPPFRLPDGPPLNRAQLAEFRLHLADGINASYAAFYFDSAANELVSVYGLEFPSDTDAIMFRRNSRMLAGSADHVYVVPLGRIVAAIFGDGECARAVDAYVRNLRP